MLNVGEVEVKTHILKCLAAAAAEVAVAVPEETPDKDAVMYLRVCAALLFTSSTGDSQAAPRAACIDTLRKYLVNIVSNPEEHKFCRIKLTNKVEVMFL